MRTKINFFLLLSAISTILNAQTDIVSTLKWDNANSSGNYLIYRNNSTYNIPLNNIRKPIVFVEGFDPNNDYIIDPTRIQYLLKSDIYSIISKYGLASNLHINGHDIAVLNFNNGGDYIQRNAMLLVELINQINANKPNQSEDLVVIGFSMGGLVARYALTYMEEHNMNHKTRLYVSYDSPHKGAHIPLSIQALATSFNVPVIKALFPDLQKSINQLTAPAATQMLKYRLSNGATQDNGTVTPSADFTNFYNELNSLNSCNGFPKNCRIYPFRLVAGMQLGSDQI